MSNYQGQLAKAAASQTLSERNHVPQGAPANAPSLVHIAMGEIREEARRLEELIEVIEARFDGLLAPEPPSDAKCSPPENDPGHSEHVCELIDIRRRLNSIRSALVRLVERAEC